jgi:chloramphenicol 3-O phosphotransferase
MTVIFLNGTTSAGKTSLAEALQDHLPGVWLRIGIDDGFAMLGRRYHGDQQGFWFDPDDAGAVRLNFGPAGLAALSAYRRAAAAIAAGGANVIIDDVLLSRGFLDDWLAVLPDVPIMMIGVHCALAVLESRERARGDRMIGQARGQLPHVHADARYDIEVDTGITPIAACAGIIADALSDTRRFAAFTAMRTGAGIIAP